MTNRIKVLQLQTKYHVRVSDPHEEIIKALPPSELDVTAGFLTGRPDDKDMTSTAESVKYFDFSKNKLKWYRIGALFRLWQYCRQQKFAVVITHLFKPFLMMLVLNKVLKIPNCIAVIHSYGRFDRWYRRILVRYLLDDKWKVVAVSNYVRQYLINARCGLSEHNVITIDNALDIEKIESKMLTREEARTKLGLNPDDFVFGNIGRLVVSKGQIFMIRAFQRVLDHHPDAKLVIIGGGELEYDLKTYIEKNNLKDSVYLVGEIYNAYRYMKALDVFILCSLKEAFGLVLLEAMIAKTPIISTDAGGPACVLPDYIALVEPGNIKTLYNAMLEMSELSRQERQNMANRLHAHLLENFSIEQYRNRHRSLVMANN